MRVEKSRVGSMGKKSKGRTRWRKKRQMGNCGKSRNNEKKSEMKVVTERKDGKRENKKDRCKAERKAERN